MGYYVELIDADFNIPLDRLEEAYAAMCELNRYDKLKRGGSHPANTVKPEGSTSLSNNPNKWFSWMDWNYDEVCESAQEILEELGFFCEAGEAYLSITGYDSKVGNEDQFISALAPYAVALRGGNPFLKWEGEDDEVWTIEVLDAGTPNARLDTPPLVL